MSKTKDRIRQSQLHYKQELGQNFIYDEALLQALVEASGVTKDDDVLEIGPGAGSLTKPLCASAHHVLSLELDERLIPLLSVFMEGADNFTLVQGDVMTANLPELTAGLRKPFCVVANIPYYITTPLLTLLLKSNLPIRLMALMVQREVADKLLTKPGEEGWGPLSIRAQYRCEPRLAMEVPAAYFTPAPKVDSAFVVLPVREKPAVNVKSETDFFAVVGAAFALRRKTLVNSLAASLRLERAEAVELVEKAGLDPMIRGEKLSMEDFARLADVWTGRTSSVSP
ncbi:MAG: ribosomal RNA small subunit methyltransferase A [Clostridia bacterium]|nr:ribosomal RNA small subunit methyltransferase A [Clostridia bacterium]